MKGKLQATLKTNSIQEIVIHGKKTIHAIIPTSSFRNVEIPNDANSRSFTGVRNKSVAAMRKTLKEEPEMFRYKNLGIRIIASDYIREDDELTLYFGEGEGIFNGVHTYEVIKTIGRDNAFVFVKVDLNVAPEDLSEVSVALNMSKKLELTSQGEKIGAFDWIKKALPTESIWYKEGDTGEYGVDDIIKVAYVFKTLKGNQYSNNSLSKAINRIGPILKENNERQSFVNTRFLLPEVWELFKQVKNSEKIQKNLPAKFVKNNEIPRGLALLFVAGIRYATEVNRNGFPMLKEGYDAEKCLKICEKLSVKVGKELAKAPFRDMTADASYRDLKLTNTVLLHFASELK